MQYEEDFNASLRAHANIRKGETPATRSSSYSAASVQRLPKLFQFKKVATRQIEVTVKDTAVFDTHYQLEFAP